MAPRKNYTVAAKTGLNVRKAPSKSAPVLRVLTPGTKVTVINAAETPEGWKVLRDGGFVMSEYLK